MIAYLARLYDCYLAGSMIAHLASINPAAAGLMLAQANLIPEEPLSLTDLPPCVSA